jgi:NitT/TauT family transport system permease protein
MAERAVAAQTKTAPQADPGVAEKRFSRSLKINLARLLMIVVFLAAWEYASGRWITEFFVSKPSAIAAVLSRWVADGSLFYHSSITAIEAFAGFAIGGAAGIAVGIILGRSEFLAELLQPFITAFYSLPKVALAPLFVLWLGIGMEMKITLTASIVFFLVFLNTFTGVRNVSQELITILRLMGATEWHVLTKAILPSAIAWVFAGLRISVPYALIGAIVGELIASNRGLGFLLSSSAGQFQTAGVFGALLAIMVLAGLLNLLVMLAEHRLMPWKAAETGREISI